MQQLSLWSLCCTFEKEVRLSPCLCYVSILAICHLFLSFFSPAYLNSHVGELLPYFFPLIFTVGGGKALPGPSNAGPSNVGQPDSLYGSFPSVPRDLSPIPSDASVPSIPSIPSYDGNEREQSVNQREARPALPANPVASRGEEAGPSNQPLPVEAYPYTDTEVIGGDSVSAIQLRLLEKDPSPSAAIIGGARLEAQDLFEVKVEIIKLMAGLDPQGDWMGRGALALENPRTATGEESLGKLYSLLGDLQRDGVQSATYSQLKGKVFLRMDPDEHSSA